MNNNELNKILENHSHWINRDCEEWEILRADLSGADLNGANLSEANLFRADLNGANLSEANLFRADLSGANLSGANLYGSNLYGSNLTGADLSESNLRRSNLGESNLRKSNLSGANLYGSNLCGSILYGADLYGADLREAVDIPIGVQAALMACPEEGSFIGWKYAEGCLIKLQIPEDARRSSATTRKCRCSYAKVLDIIKNEEHIDYIEHLAYTHLTVYKVGEYVYPDSFDDDRWYECSHGIHFFITKQEALDYGKERMRIKKAKDAHHCGIVFDEKDGGI